MLPDKGMSLYPYVVVYIKWVSFQERHLPGRHSYSSCCSHSMRERWDAQEEQRDHMHIQMAIDERENFDIEYFWEKPGERCRVRCAFVKSIKTLVSWCEETEEKSFGFSINHGLHRDEVRNQYSFSVFYFGMIEDHPQYKKMLCYMEFSLENIKH